MASAVSSCARSRLQDFQRRPVLGLYCQQHRQLIQLSRTLRDAGVDVYEATYARPSAT